MKMIREVKNFIRKELDDSERYIDCATKYKGDSELMYNTALKLAQQELDHAMYWHDVAVAEINKMKEKMHQDKREIPEYMKLTWEEEHKEYLERVSKIKCKLELLRK